MAALRLTPSVDDLRTAVRGPVLSGDDSRFAEEAACFNVAVHHRPEVIVGATCAEDVQAAVRWANENDVPVAVQATGHGAIVPIEGGLLITTHRMQNLHIDPHAKLAIIDAGVKWRRVIDEAAPFELAPLSGSSSDVGAIGYTLGGGLPVLGRTYGYSSDLVVSFDVVTPDGELRRVTAEDEGELFWALRGGKTSAAIVTSMTVELVPVGDFYAGAIYYDGEYAPAVFAAFAEWCRDLPDEMTSSLSLMRLPDLPDVPEPLRERFTVHLAVAYVGEPEDGEALMRPMREVAPSIIDYVGVMPYTDADRVHNDPQEPVPLDHANLFLPELSPEAISALMEQAGPGADSPLLMVQVRHLGGALARAAREDAAGVRSDGFLAFFLGLLVPPIADLVPAAIAAAADALAPYSTGRTLVNMHGAPRSEDDRSRPWDAAQADRLRQLKERLDPQGRFRFGHWS